MSARPTATTKTAKRYYHKHAAAPVNTTSMNFRNSYPPMYVPTEAGYHAPPMYVPTEAGYHAPPMYVPTESEYQYLDSQYAPRSFDYHPLAYSTECYEPHGYMDTAGKFSHPRHYYEPTSAKMPHHYAPYPTAGGDDKHSHARTAGWMTDYNPFVYEKAKSYPETVTYALRDTANLAAACFATDAAGRLGYHTFRKFYPISGGSEEVSSSGT